MGAEALGLRGCIHSSPRGGVVKTLKVRGIGPVRVVHTQKVVFLIRKAHFSGGI